MNINLVLGDISPLGEDTDVTHLFTEDGVDYYRGVLDNWIVRVGIPATSTKKEVVSIDIDDRETVRPWGKEYVLVDGDTKVYKVLGASCEGPYWVMSYVHTPCGSKACHFFGSEKELKGVIDQVEALLSV